MKSILHSMFLLLLVMCVAILSVTQKTYAEIKPLVDDNDQVQTFDVGAVLFRFIPLGTLNDGSVYGASFFMPDKSEKEEEEDEEEDDDDDATSIVSCLYVVCEKNASESDVYMVDLVLENVFAHITVSYEGEDKTVRFAGKTITPEVSCIPKEELGADIDSLATSVKKLEGYDYVFETIQGIAKTYRESGAATVKMTYGKPFLDSFFDNSRREEARKKSKPKNIKKKKSYKPKLDKHGCIAYVDDPKLIRVVSKRIEPCSSGYQWTCKVKNTSSSTVVKSCYVEVKHYDKKGLEIEHNLSSVDRIEPGQTRIISGRTRMSSQQRKRVKRTEFHVETFTL